MRMTIRELADALVRNLGRQEFKWLKEHAKSTPELLAMLNRRLAGEPLQYILGTQPFGPLDIIVRPPVLIPRPETEDWALRLARRLASPSHISTLEPLKILDLCTGTGCIPLLLCHMCKSSSYSRSIRALGIDISSDAVALARENAKHVQTGMKMKMQLKGDDDVSFIQADILRDSFPRILKNLGWPPVDVLTANPPYIPLHEYESLPSSVKDYEDRRALLGEPDANADADVGPDPDPPGGQGQDQLEKSEGGRLGGRGLTFYRAIARLIRAEEGIVKRGGGLVVLEVGQNQAWEVAEMMMREGGVGSTEVWKDPYGVERTVVCRDLR